MLLIRNLIYWLILIFSLILLFPLMMAGTLLPNGLRRVANWWVNIQMWTLKHLIGLNYRISGSENMPDHPVIVCAKHQSGWETLALQVILPPVVFVAKRELFKIPLFGWALKWLKTIGIDRSSKHASEHMLQQGLERKQEGLWIVIFPEGTRVAPGSRGRYKMGAARMAKMFEMDLLPIALNSGEFWPRNSFMKYPGTIDVVIGPPISHQSGNEIELTTACENWIEAQQQTISGHGPCHPHRPASN